MRNYFNFLYLDTETLGLSLLNHDIWEVAYAFGEGDVQASTVAHDRTTFEEAALRVNQYGNRVDPNVTLLQSQDFEERLHRELHAHKNAGRKITLVGANPSFDAYRISRRWGWDEPWAYRFLDIGVYAQAAMRAMKPQGLNKVCEWIRDHGRLADMPQPDHTAKGDVECVREAHSFLAHWYDTPLDHIN